MSTSNNIKILSFSGNTRILHLSWIAFFITFVIWFNHAPLLAAMRESMGLTDQQIKTLLILNVALTIPARIIIGMLVDSFGPKRIYSMLLMVSSLLCFGFAMADDYEQLALMRFLLGFAGAGFVIGIRMISEWYPARQAGIAQGIYGGWGNFGSAGAAISLPTIALMFGGDDGWRYAIASTGVLAFIYSFIYYFSTHDTPKGSTYFKPKKSGALEVSSKGDFVLYLIMNIPMYAALAVLTWKLSPVNLGMLDAGITNTIYIVLTGIYAYQSFRMYQVNQHVFEREVPEIERYNFSQVAVLNLSYMVTFGSELAIVSMLPLYFMDTFELTAAGAGMVASVFAGLNLIMRPAGGWISDKYGRKRSLVVIMFCLIAGYALMSQMNASWSLSAAVAVTIFCSIFVNAGNGAVFAVVPLIKRRLTGQIAGMTGAYGNVGAVTFLTVLSFVSSEIFFLVISAAAVMVFLATAFILKEPAAKMTEVLPDGTVQVIET
ncbi:Nitrate/nitrite transporter [hydrothermal vent metagenome]|uniref:Nitrate/nitrite transporter n=1 Tax=hydrothermal vent metagenome TaxID=652676 RepID=A0A3B0XAW1_9ZZZZ